MRARTRAAFATLATASTVRSFDREPRFRYGRLEAREEA